jgi:hypothetical protein
MVMSAPTWTPSPKKACARTGTLSYLDRAVALEPSCAQFRGHDVGVRAVS